MGAVSRSMSRSWLPYKQDQPPAIRAHLDRTVRMMIRRSAVVRACPYTYLPPGDAIGESHRDSASKPKVARNELPWVTSVRSSQLQRSCALADEGDAANRRSDMCGIRRNPAWGWGLLAIEPKVARRLATLGWWTQSRWDWTFRVRCTKSRVMLDFRKFELAHSLPRG